MGPNFHYGLYKRNFLAHTGKMANPIWLLFSTNKEKKGKEIE